MKGLISRWLGKFIRTYLGLFLLVFFSFFAQSRVSFSEANLLAHFPFNQDFDDATGFISSKSQGAKLVQDAKRGLVLNTKDGPVKIDPMVIGDGDGKFSISLWIKHNRDSSWGRILAGYERSDEHELTMFISSSKQLGLKSSITSNAYDRKHIVPLDEWFHLALVWDGENITTYLNGVVSQDLDGRFSTQSALVPWFVGSNSNSGDIYRGLIDELRFFRGVLSAVQIDKLFKEQPSDPIDVKRNAFLIPIDSNASSWRDLAFLAAAPLVNLDSDHSSSLIALNDANGVLGEEVEDYLKRLRPAKLITINPKGDTNINELPNIVAHFPFDENFNDVYSGIRGESGDATLVNDPERGMVLSPNGGKGVLARVGDVANSKNQFSISYWIKHSKIAEWGRFFTVTNTSDNNKQALKMFVASSKQTGFVSHITPNYYDPHLEYTYGKWHHAVVTWDGHTMQNYIDARETRPSRDAFTPGQLMSTLWRIGSGKNGAYGYYGFIDDVRIYSGVLTHRMVTALAANNQPELDYKPARATDVATVIPGNDAVSIACSLVERYFTQAAKVVLSSVNDYQGSLVASGLAGNLKAPLLFIDEGVQRNSCVDELLQKLNTKQLLVIGQLVNNDININLPKILLPNSFSVIDWMHSNDMKIDYIAIANPMDRQNGTVKKVSLLAPLLASRHNGLVATLPYDVRYKYEFGVDREESVPPPGVSAGITPRYRRGKIKLDGKQYDFVTVSTQYKWNKFFFNILYIDINGNGYFGDANEGQLHAGDDVTLGNRSYSITVAGPNSRTRLSLDIALTSPTIHTMKTNLSDRYYKPMGYYPKHLAMVGWYDAIPFAITSKSAFTDREDIISDAPFAEIDESPFAEIAIGRIIGENVQYASVALARSLSYNTIRNMEWGDKLASIGPWYEINAPGIEALESVGMTLAYTGDENYRRYEDDHNLIGKAVITHAGHGASTGWGAGLERDFQVMLDPVVAESLTGCESAGLDQNPVDYQIATRFLRRGAVAFLGNTRPATADGDDAKAVFWQAVVTGKTLGESLNITRNFKMQQYLDNHNSYNYITYRVANLYGDPAFKFLPIPK